MRAGSLFTGVGGLDLAVEAHGFEVAWQVENDPYCTRVLERHWPGMARHGDVKTLDPAQLEPVDLVVGGPPCQPFSTAGKRKVTNDDRWLWPEMARIVRVLRPRLVFVEAPAGLLSPWRDDRRRWRAAPVEAVLGDLAALGFGAEWVCLRASDVAAPHERERVFILAYAPWIRDRRTRLEAGDGRQAGLADPDGGGRRPFEPDDAARQPDPAWRGTLAHADGGGQLQPSGRRDSEWLWAGHIRPDVADAAVLGRGEGRPVSQARNGNAVAAAGGHPVADPDGPRPPRRTDRQAAVARRAAAGPGGELPEPGVGRGPDGLPRGLDGHRWPAGQGEAQHDWEPPRTVIAKSLPNRVQRVTALGNAVVPQQGALALSVLWARMESAR